MDSASLVTKLGLVTLSSMLDPTHPSDRKAGLDGSGCVLLSGTLYCCFRFCPTCQEHAFLMSVLLLSCREDASRCSNLLNDCFILSSVLQAYT